VTTEDRYAKIDTIDIQTIEHREKNVGIWEIPEGKKVMVSKDMMFGASSILVTRPNS